MKTNSIIILVMTSSMLVFSQNAPTMPLPPFLSVETISPSTVDARSVAMGRTSIVSATGSNSIFSNSGIIATFDTLNWQVGGRMIMGTREDESYEGRAAIGNSYSDTYTPHYVFNHFSIAKPHQLSDSDTKLAFGIGYRALIDLGMSREIKSKIDWIKSSEKSTRNGGLYVITPTIAINLQDKYFLGVTLNKSVFGSIIHKTNFTEDDSSYITSAIKSKMEIDHSASFLQYGGLAKISEQLTLGFSFTPEWEWEWDKIKYTYDGEISDPSSSNDIEITVPSVFGIGATSQLSPKLLIAAEYQNRKYSDFEMNNLSISGIDDGSCYRFGAEYREKQTLLRYGYFSDAVYASDENNDDEPLSLTGFTGGIGHNLGEVYVDAFIEYSSLTVEYEDTEIGTYDVTTNMFRFGLSVSSIF